MVLWIRVSWPMDDIGGPFQFMNVVLHGYSGEGEWPRVSFFLDTG